MSGERIVLIEDDREIQSTLKTVLSEIGYRVSTATNGVDGQKLIQDENPELVITDMMMPRMGGFPVLEYLKTIDNPPSVIMITANEGGRHKAYAEMLGAVDYLRKPFAMDVLLDSVKNALEKRAEQNAGKSSSAPLGKRVGKKKSNDD